MLCKECTDIFDCSRRDIGDQYLSLGKRALLKLKEIFGNRPEVDEYENHLLEFAQRLQDLDLGGRLPCPWYSRDLLWLGPVLQDESGVIKVLEGPRDGAAIVRAAAEGCDLCSRVRLVASQFYDKGEITKLWFDCSIFINGVSLKPRDLWFDIIQNNKIDQYIPLELVSYGGRLPFRSSR